MSDDIQQDIDQAAEAQQLQDEHRRLENSGNMDPRCFTRPMPIFPHPTAETRKLIDDYNKRVMDLILGTLERK